MAAPPQKKEWKIHSFGVLCLVQDTTIQSAFMRLYCLKVRLQILHGESIVSPVRRLLQETLIKVCFSATIVYIPNKMSFAESFKDILKASI